MRRIFTLFLVISSNLIFAQGWVEQYSGVNTMLTSVSTPSFETAWICGYNGVILRTTNQGLNWINKSGNGIPNAVQLVNILGLNASNAICAGYIGSNTYVYKTTNGGDNWIQVFTEYGGFINAICKLYGGMLIMQGNPVSTRWSLWKSTNNGSTWDSSGLYLTRNGTELGHINSMWSFDYSTRVWFGTNNYRIYYSTNNGTNWLTLPTPTEQNSYAIWFSGAEGLFGGANMLRTSDYGFNWSSVTTLGTGNFGGITGTHIPVNSPVIYEMLHYVRSDNKIYFTTSNATNWQIIYTSPNGIYTYITSIRSGVGSPFWAIRNNGGISYRDRMGGIKIINSNTPETYTLYQNYPNPFNPRTVFRFALSIAGMTNLRVFDILGRGVTTLLTEQLKPGTYEVDFDGTNYPSGVYFYKLETGKFVKTKKMVLIK